LTKALASRQHVTNTATKALASRQHVTNTATKALASRQHVTNTATEALASQQHVTNAATKATAPERRRDALTPIEAGHRAEKPSVLSRPTRQISAPACWVPRTNSDISRKTGGNWVALA
jgi:hypothetical protein